MKKVKMLLYLKKKTYVNIEFHFRYHNQIILLFIIVKTIFPNFKKYY